MLPVPESTTVAIIEDIFAINLGVSPMGLCQHIPDLAYALCIPPLLVVGSIGIGCVGEAIDIPQLGTVSDISAILYRNPPNVKTL